jgi:hypothetical protein
MQFFLNQTFHCIVIPAKAGIHCKKPLKFKLDSRLRGNDGK